jgi:hypothetical protein
MIKKNSSLGAERPPISKDRTIQTRVDREIEQTDQDGHDGDPVRP